MMRRPSGRCHLLHPLAVAVALELHVVLVGLDVFGREVEVRRHARQHVLGALGGRVVVGEVAVHVQALAPGGVPEPRAERPERHVRLAGRRSAMLISYQFLPIGIA